MSVVEPESGLVIGGKYRLLERIGVGGMSEVYRAENTLIGRVVALKLLHREQSGDQKLAARFFQEAQSVSRIRHPVIVDVLDAGLGETGPFIVMEYLEGESAAHVLARQGKLSIAAALATLLPVLEALQAAHDAGVIHRDLKPENVFYAASDAAGVEVKLLDFGIAKMLWPVGPTPRTSTGVVFGTPDYLSPEQANGEPVIDGRSDLFSAGVVLFELLTNVRPFHAPTAVATAYKVAHARTPSLREHGGPHQAALDAVLNRALQKRAEERYANAREFASELRALAQGLDLTTSLRGLVRVQRTSGERLVPSLTPALAVSGSMKVGSSPELAAVRSSMPRPESSMSAHAARRVDTPAFGDRGSTLASVRAGTLSSTPQRGSHARPSVPPRPPARVPERTPAGASRSLRFLPSRFAGRCHARGLVLRAIDAHVRKAFSADEHEAILSALDEEQAKDFRYGTLQAIVYYDLELLTSYLELTTTRLHRSDPSWCRAAGEAAVETELSALLRRAHRPGKPLDVLRRLTPIVARFFDFGHWESQADDPKLVCLKIADFEPASLAIRLWLAGVIEGSLRVCGARPHVAISRGEVGFSPHFAMDISAL